MHQTPQQSALGGADSPFAVIRELLERNGSRPTEQAGLLYDVLYLISAPSSI